MSTMLIPNFPNYTITNNGTIINNVTKKKLNQNGRRIVLSYQNQSKSFIIERLIYELFVDTTRKLTQTQLVAFKDGDKTNLSHDNLYLINNSEIRKRDKVQLDPSKKWVSIINFPKYMVSNHGDIYSLRTNTLSKYNSTLKPGEYSYVSLINKQEKKKVAVHQVVFYSFNPHIIKTKHLCIDHIDRNKTNNSLTNLRLVNASENAKNITPKILPAIDQCTLDGTFIKRWDNVHQIKEILNYRRENIDSCCNGSIKSFNGFIWKRNSKLAEKEKNIQDYKEINVGTGEFFCNYKINKFGKIINKFNTVIKGKLCNGYLRVSLTNDKCTKWFYVHRLVANTFIPNPNNYPVVNHKDKNRLNNLANNLEWVTVLMNNVHGSGKKIVQIDLKTKLPIEYFNSIQEAIIKYGDPKTSRASRISLVCNGKGKSAFGYGWQWVV